LAEVGKKKMTRMPEPKSAKTVVVDEEVSDDNVTRFKNFAARRGLTLADCLYIRHLHAGMPDGHALRHLLGCRTTNEIQEENLGEILCRFAEHGEMLTQSTMPGEEMTA
jgi:hypothetical protein